MKLSTALKIVDAHPSKRYSFVFLTEEKAAKQKESWYTSLYNQKMFVDYTIKRRGNVLTIERWT